MESTDDMEHLLSSLNAMEELDTPFVVFIQHPAADNDHEDLSEPSEIDRAPEGLIDRAAEDSYEHNLQHEGDQAISNIVAAAQDLSLATDVARNTIHCSRSSARLS